MKKMRKRERVEAAMAFEETDRVPVYDLFLHDGCIAYFTGKQAPAGEMGLRLKCRTIRCMLDMTRSADVGPREPYVEIDEDGFVERHGRWLDLGLEKRPFDCVKGAAEWLEKKIERMKRNDRKRDISAESEAFIARFQQIQDYIGDDTVVLLRQSGTGLDELRYRLGLELFSYLSVDHPELITEYMCLHTCAEVRMIHAVADYSLSPCALTYGDIAMKGTLLHSPEWLRKEFFPNLKLLNDAYHEHGIKCLFHSDGYLMPVIEDLLSTGIDGLNPIETAAGMSVRELRTRFGKTLFLAGGIDMSQLLPYGAASEVRSICEQTIREADGGYFIGSTTELENTARLENVLEMLETAGVEDMRDGER